MLVFIANKFFLDTEKIIRNITMGLRLSIKSQYRLEKRLQTYNAAITAYKTAT